MKHLIVFFSLFLLILSGANAQTFTAKASKGGGYDVEKGKPTSEVLTVDGKDWPVFTSDSGSKFIKAISAKTNSEYALWIGNKTDAKFEGRVVHTFSSGSYCYFKTGKNGSPVRVWLDKN